MNQQHSTAAQAQVGPFVAQGRRVSRRSFLRGAGIVLSLPLLYAMAPAFAAAGQSQGATPRRMLAVCNNLGLVPEAASSMLLPRMAGYHRAAEMLLLGERFDARAALAAGIVNSLHPESALAAVVKEKAAALVAKPPASIRMTKALLKRDPESIPSRMAEEGKCFGQQLKSPEVREAVEAFMQRRKPDFLRFA